MTQPDKSSSDPAPWNVDSKHCWVWPGYFCKEGCPYRTGSRSLFALTASDAPKCALGRAD